jgi:probable HAF family extracellular repeat protein
VAALSFDGARAAGYQRATGQPFFGFVWDEAHGRSDYIFPGGSPLLTAISSDGSVATGSGVVPSVTPGNALRVLAGGQFEDLGRPAGVSGTSASEAISADGSTIVGYFQNSTSSRTAFRWTPQTGCVVLSSRGDGRTATGVSADGRTIVGWTGYNLSLTRAFVWREGQGVSQLPWPSDYPSGSASAYAHAISGDGRIIVGSSDGPEYNDALMWVDGIPQRIRGPEGWIAIGAYAVDHDGDTMLVSGRRVGTTPFDPSTTLIMSAEYGFMEAREFLIAHGAVLPETAQIQVTCLSGDGRSFGGSYFDPAVSPYGQGFVFTVPTPASGVVGLAACQWLARRCRARA